MCVLWARKLTMQIVCKEDAMSASIMTIVLDIDQERMWKQMPRGRPNKITGEKELQEKIIRLITFFWSPFRV